MTTPTAFTIACRALLSLLALLFGTGLSVVHAYQSAVPLPNWGLPTYLSDYPLPALSSGQNQIPFTAGPCTSAPTSGLSFTFTINDSGSLPGTPTQAPQSGALSTSAAVYDVTTNTLAATLWSSVTIANGIYCGSWNGLLDYGPTPNPAPIEDIYQVRLLHDNVQYVWDGMVGETESSLGGPVNRDETGGFPAAISFLVYPLPGGSATEWGILSNGYNELQFESNIFKSYDPTTGQGDADSLWPLNLALVEGGEFDMSTTDGNVIYFGVHGNYGLANAVVGFTLTSTLPPLSSTPIASIVTTNSNGTQINTLGPLTTFGGPPWGVPYIFTDVNTPIPPGPTQDHYFSGLAGVLQNNGLPPSLQVPGPSSTFVNGIAVGASTGAPLTMVDPSGTKETVTTLLNPITGIAVENDNAGTGNLLAVAQGVFLPVACFSQPVGGNSIALWDKRSGDFLTTLALFSSMSPSTSINPQSMVFDGAGNLWLINGGNPAVDCTYPSYPVQGNRNGQGPDPLWASYGSLVKITFGGGGSASSPPTVTSITIIPTLSNGQTSVNLSNPIYLAISPSTGHLFVADGGSNQQVFEFDPSTLTIYSVTGTWGGYGQSNPDKTKSCNASITANTFWLDYIGRQTGSVQPWIAVDNENDLWVGDYTTSRVMRFQNVGGSYVPLSTSFLNRSLYYDAVPRNAPNRVFSGPTGLLEYSVDYPNPDPETTSTPPNGNSAFTSIPVNNWLPCLMRAQWLNGGYPHPAVGLSSAEQFSGGTFAFVRYHSNNPVLKKESMLLNLNANGTLSVKRNAISVEQVWFDVLGNFYSVKSIGGACGQALSQTSICSSLYQFKVMGLDGNQFPTWSPSGTLEARVSLNLGNGDPMVNGGSDGYDLTPTVNQIIPIFSGNGWDWHSPSSCQPSTSCAPTSGPTYHLAGVPVNGTGTQWHAQLEADVEYPTMINDPNGWQSAPIPSGGTAVNNLGLYPTWQTYAGPANTGYAVHSIDNYIFTAINTNWQQYSCQFYQYQDDGLLVGQFGWRATGPYGSIFNAGHPSHLLMESSAPGLCGNPQQFKIIKYNGDYYLYVTDEGYRAGIQRWHILNIGSITELRGSTTGPLSLQTSPLTLE